MWDRAPGRAMGTVLHARDIILHVTALRCGALPCHRAPSNARGIVLCHGLYDLHCDYQMWGTMPWALCFVPQLSDVGHCCAMGHQAMPGALCHAMDSMIHIVTTKCGAPCHGDCVMPGALCFMPRLQNVGHCCATGHQAMPGALCHAMGSVIHIVTIKCGVQCHGHCVTCHGSQMWGITMGHGASCYPVVPNYGVPCHAWGIVLLATAPQRVALQCHGALCNARSTVLHATTPDCEALQCCRAPCQSSGHCAMTGTPCSVPQIPNVGHCSAVRHQAMPWAPWLSNVGHCNATGLLLCSGPLFPCFGALCPSTGHPVSLWGTINSSPFQDVPQRCQP